MSTATKPRKNLTKPATEQTARARHLDQLAEDARVRYALDLRYVGLKYGPFGRAPKELFRSLNGRFYIKHSLGKYEETLP